MAEALGWRKNRIINLQLWDSCLSYENHYFRANPKTVNPRDPLKLIESEINYEIDSEDELQELMGENAESSGGEDDDSESREFRRDNKGNDLDLVEDGWIVDSDDYSDSSNNSSVSWHDGENEAEHEIRR